MPLFSLFTKKVFLRDQLQGLTDIHNHILPGLDDGAEDMKSSLDMARLFVQLGYSSVIATPHIMEDLYGLDESKIKVTRQDLKEFLEKEGISLTLLHAAEHMTDRRFETMLKEESLLPLTQRMVLIETGFLQPPMALNQMLFNLSQAGYVPVLAHPERYHYLNNLRDFTDLKNRGCLLQLNLLSLSGHYGPDVKKKAETLLDNTLIDFIGTDAHRAYHLHKIAETKIPDRLLPAITYAVAKQKELF